MNRKSTMIAVIAGIILLLGGLGLALRNGSGSNMTKRGTSQPAAGTQSEGMSDMDMTQSRQASGQVQETDKVDIRDFKFVPSKIKIKKGTTVTWTNQDSTRHDVNPLEKSEAFVGSELLAKGESYSFTFNAAGTYDYNCSPHPYMKGTVEVVE